MFKLLIALVFAAAAVIGLGSYAHAIEKVTQSSDVIEAGKPVPPYVRMAEDDDDDDNDDDDDDDGDD